jgi:hypothetical protein
VMWREKSFGSLMYSKQYHIYPGSSEAPVGAVTCAYWSWHGDCHGGTKIRPHQS